MLDSSSDTVAILYDIENAPIEMLQYTIDQAQRYQPCRMIVVSDWEAHPEQKRWNRLMEYPDLTFRQISRTFYGKNSLDSALYDSAQILYQEGVRKYFIITTDSDFVQITESLNRSDPSYIIGVGTKQASEDLRNAYNEFFVYPPESSHKKKMEKNKKDAQNTEVKKLAKKKTSEDKGTKQKTSVEQPAKPVEQKKAPRSAMKKKTIPDKQADEKNANETGKPTVKTKKKQVQKASSIPSETPQTVATGFLTVRLPKTLRTSLEQKMLEEEVSLDELVTYLLMRGLAAK